VIIKMKNKSGQKKEKKKTATKNVAGSKKRTGKSVVKPKVSVGKEEVLKETKEKKVKPEKKIKEKKVKYVSVPPEGLSPKEISEKIKKDVSEIISFLISLHVFVSAEQKITDRDVIELVLLHFNYQPKFEEKKEEKIEETKKVVEIPEETKLQPQGTTVEEIKKEEKTKIEVKKKEIPPNWVKKIPVVTVMGHVDHGKTTLLDTIRKTNVAAQEAGAITQHIGAYKVSTPYGDITFIDTPGHEAFSTIRSRGAKVTDIVVLVVAGDEGVMPQTIESLNHAKSANVPIIVAINKIDLPQCNPNSVKQQFASMGMIPKDWGGEVEFVEISARNNINIDKLLETILLQAEFLELYVPIDVPCEATVIETKLDLKRGFVATVIVDKGKLKVGDSFVCGLSYGKIRAMFNDKAERINELLPGEPAEILGFEKPCVAGDTLKVVPSEKEAKRIYEELEYEQKLAAAKKKAFKPIEELISGKSNLLSLVIKTDTQGSLEAIQKMIDQLKEEIKNNPNLPELKIVHSAVGEITESDVLLATTSKAVVIGFNVRPNMQALKRAESESVEIRTYRIIYELIDDIKKIIYRMEVKQKVEEFLGRAVIKRVFEISKVGKVAGCIVEEGKIVRNANVRILRDNVIIADTKISSLKHFKEDVKEVQQGYECGIRFENFQDFKENDVVECYQIVEK
jgi:translation initiation factor IF-2